MGLNIAPPTQASRARREMFNHRYTLSPGSINFLVTRILIAINAGWVCLSFFDQSLAVALTREDKAIEWLQFIFLLLTAFYCLRVFLCFGRFYEERLIRNGFLMIFMLTLLVALEEISWGQRVFGIATPDSIKLINTQNEISIHNLSAFQRYRHWLLLVFGGSGLALIFLRGYVKKIDAKYLFFFPPDFFKVAFYLILLSGIFFEIGKLMQKFNPGELADFVRFWAGRYTEIGELGVSITAFCYASDRFNSMPSIDR